MPVPRPRKGYSGLPQSFCADWCRTISVAPGAPGGQILVPDGYRPDWKVGLTLGLGGVGQAVDAAISKLFATKFRAANSGRGRIVAALQGTKNATGNYYFNGHRALYNSQSSKPWATATPYVHGDRATRVGNTYMCRTPGISGAGPSGIGDNIVDGVNGLTWWCMVQGGTADADVPDDDWVCGPSRTVNGIVRPEGFLPRFLRSWYIDETRINIASYSNGGALADQLIRRYPQYFKSAVILCSTGTPLDDPRYIAAGAAGAGLASSILEAGATNDVTVRFGGAPPASTTAIGDHPSNQASLEHLAAEMGQPGTLTDTGGRVNFTTIAGNEAEIHRYPTQLVDVRGNPINFTWIRIVGADHNISIQPDGFKIITDWLDYNPRN